MQGFFFGGFGFRRRLVLSVRENPQKSAKYDDLTAHYLPDRRPRGGSAP